MQPEYREGKLLLKFKYFLNALSVSGVVYCMFWRPHCLQTALYFSVAFLNSDHINEAFLKRHTSSINNVFYESFKLGARKAIFHVHEGRLAFVYTE